MTQTATSYSYEQLEVGQKSNSQRQVSQTDIEMFAAVSGDCNPVHLDAEFAASTAFKSPKAHGMLSGALISAAIALNLPGPGSIYLEQQLSFLRPIKPGDLLNIELEVLEKLPKNRVRIATRIFNQQNKAMVHGEALVLAPAESERIELPGLTKFDAPK